MNARGANSRQKFQTGLEAPPKNALFPAPSRMQPIRGAQPSGSPPATSWRAHCQPRPSVSSGRTLSLRRRSFSWRRPGAMLAMLCGLECLRRSAKFQPTFGPLRPGSPDTH